MKKILILILLLCLQLSCFANDEIKDQYYKLWLNNSISGYNSFSSGNYNNAITYFENALKYKDLTKNKTANNNYMMHQLAEAYYFIEKYNKSKYYAEKLLSIGYKQGFRTHELAANSCYMLGENQKAVIYYQEAINIICDLEIKHYYSSCLINEDEYSCFIRKNKEAKILNQKKVEFASIINEI